MEKIKLRGFLIRRKEHFDKSDPPKRDGLGICVRSDPFDDDSKNNIWFNMWFNNDTHYNLYIRHKGIYDNLDVANPDEFLVEVTYHMNDRNFKELDDIVFLDEKIKEVVDKAIDRGEVTEAVELKGTKKDSEIKTEFRQASQINKSHVLEMNLSEIMTPRDISIIRQSCLKAAAESGRDLENVTKDDIIVWAKRFAEWVVTGR